MGDSAFGPTDSNFNKIRKKNEISYKSGFSGSSWPTPPEKKEKKK